jgi:hypothetical protein
LVMMAKPKKISGNAAAPGKKVVAATAKKLNYVPALQGALGAVIGIAIVLTAYSLLIQPAAPSTPPTNQLSSEAVADKVVAYLAQDIITRGFDGVGVELSTHGEYNESLYEICVSLSQENQEINSGCVYATKDGRNIIIGSVLDMDAPIEQPDTTPDTTPDTIDGEINSCDDVEKTEKPTLDVFVVSRCPYGIQSMNGLVPVAELLGDNVEITVRYISTVNPDGTVSAMHGAEELLENRRQICLREEQPEIFWGYIRCYVETGNTSECELESGADSEGLSTCVAESSTDYLIADAGWGGEDRSRLASPTFYLNGKKINERSSEIFDRSPEGQKSRICCGMTTLAAECSDELSTLSPPAGFGTIGDSQATGGGSC